MKRSDMPIGFMMALSENLEAMKKFSMLSEEKKHDIVEGARNVRSRSEMSNYVNRISADL